VRIRMEMVIPNNNTKFLMTFQVPRIYRYLTKFDRFKLRSSQALFQNVRGS